MPYPAIPGHEIAGVVAAVGAGRHAATRSAIASASAAWSTPAASARTAGTATSSTASAATRRRYGSVDRDGTPTYGGYSDHVVVDQHFVLRIPDGLELDVAAPLLCAGITTYSPLRHWNAGPGKQVAIVGLGGLGHMAVKFAKAMGAEVTVLSQSLRKQEDGLRLGADAYYATSDDDDLRAARRPLRPDRQHRQREARASAAYLEPAEDRRRARQRRRAGRSRCRSRCSR